MKYETAKELKLAKVKKYQADNPEKVKETRRKHHWNIKSQILMHYGGKCACCGETDLKFLCIDHINNDGAKQRKEAGFTAGISSFYYWIKKNGFPTDLQVLCYNCNMAKALYKICPHKSLTN
jgi:hypothetical protein